jgi:hypothetical protein
MNRKQQQAVQIALKKQGVLHHYNNNGKLYQSKVLLHPNSRFDLSNVDLKDVPQIASNIRDIEVRRIKQQREDKQRSLIHKNHQIETQKKFNKLSNPKLASEMYRLQKHHNDTYNLHQKNPHNVFHKQDFEKAQNDLYDITPEHNRRKDKGRYSQVKY